MKGCNVMVGLLLQSEALRLRGQLQEAYTALEEERRNVQTTLARLKVPNPHS